MSPEAIGEAQRRLRLVTFPTHSPGWYARNGRWWILEAKRGYPSSKKSLEYAVNMKWAAETARIHGDHPWPKLQELAAR